MAITDEQIRAAVEQYLPRTPNFARSADLGEKDQQAIFKRLMQIVLTALLLDQDAVFRVVYLASQRFTASLEDAIAILQNLKSSNLLKSLVPDDPVPVQDPRELQRARVNLLRISGGIADSGRFNTTAFSGFQGNISNFLSTQIAPNVDGRNRVVISSEIRTAMESLATVWAEVRERRDLVLQTLPNFLSVDLPSIVSATVVAAVNDKLDSIESGLSTQTTAEQAENAEQVMVDLAAAQAALAIVGNAPSVLGEATLGPNTDGVTASTYLEVNSVGDTQSIAVVMQGQTGKLYVSPRVASATGEAVDDVDLDNTTPTFSDLTVDFVSAGVLAQMTLTLVETGAQHRVLTVATNQVTLSPEVAKTLTGQKYVITDIPPGSVFQDENASFWDAYTGGSTPDNAVASGVAGFFVRDDKVTGSTATNIVATGTLGSLDPDFFSSTGGAPAGFGDRWEDLAAEFLTDGVDPAEHRLVVVSGVNSPRDDLDITSVLSQTLLDLTVGGGGPLTNPTTGEGYRIRWIAGPSMLEDLGAEFISDFVSVGDDLVVTSGGFQGTYEIDEVIDQTRLLVTTTPFSAHESPVSWNVLPGDRSIVFLPGADLFVNGVEAGDFLYIGGSVDATFVIVSVDGDDRVTIDSDILLTAGFAATAFAIFADETNTTRFVQTDGVDFEVVGVESNYLIEVDGDGQEVSQLDPASPADALFILASVPIADTTPLVWSIRTADTTSSFFDTVDSPFLDLDLNGDPLFAEGDTLVINPGPSEVRVKIDEIISSEEVRLKGEYAHNLSSIPYAHVRVVREGMVLYVAGRQRTVTKVVNKTQLQVRPTLAGTIGSDVPWFITEAGAPAKTNRFVDLSIAGGFPPAMVGFSIDLMIDKPISASILGISDPNSDGDFEALDLDVAVEPGLRGVSYRILSAAEGTTGILEVTALSDAQASDRLTVWANPSVSTVVGVSPGQLQVLPPLPSGQANLRYVVTRGGSAEHGRYLLYEDLLSSASLSQNTSGLRLRVAECLIDFGAVPLASMAVGSAGTILDPDQNGFGSVFEDGTADFVASDTDVGDRLLVTVDGQTLMVYVESVISATQLKVDPELPTGTVTAWSLTRTSISGALKVIDGLYNELLFLSTVTSAYSSRRNPAIDGILSVLLDQQMDRAVDLLLQGKIADFARMSATDSSYVGKAKSAVATAGSRSRTSAATAANVAGNDPATGRPTSSGTSSSGAMATGSTATTTAARGIPEEVDVLVDLSVGTTELAGDERVQAASDVSLEELRNRAIYELTGEITSTVITDTDPTLPWIAQTGSRLARVTERAEKLKASLQYMIDHPDEFDESATEGS